MILVLPDRVVRTATETTNKQANKPKQANTGNQFLCRLCVVRNPAEDDINLVEYFSKYLNLILILNRSFAHIDRCFRWMNERTNE